MEPNKVPANFFIMWGKSSTEGEKIIFLEQMFRIASCAGKKASFSL